MSSFVKLAALGLLAVLTITGGAVAALRYIDPPFTAMMLAQPMPLAEIDYVWADRDSIAVDAALAVIAAEDQRFLRHRGFDLEAIERAVEEYRRGEGLRGASTITQQVAKNLFLWSGRSFVRKGIEAYFTVLIEALWPKERILEVYLNIAELGDGVFGVEAAAQRFFAGSAAALSREQAALLAAVLPSPRRFDVGQPSEYVRARQRRVIEQIGVLENGGWYAELHW